MMTNGASLVAESPVLFAAAPKGQNKTHCTPLGRHGNYYLLFTLRTYAWILN